MINQPETDEPLGLPRGGVRSLLSLGVVIGAFAIAAYLLAADTGSDLTKVVIGGWTSRAGARHKRPRRVDGRAPSPRLIVFAAGEHPPPLVDDRDLSGGGLDGVKLSDDAGELHLDARSGLEIGHGGRLRARTTAARDDGAVLHPHPGTRVVRVRLDLAFYGEAAGRDIGHRSRDLLDCAADVDDAASGGRAARPAL